MGLAKAVLPPKRNRAQRTVLLLAAIGERLTHAVYGMKGNVTIKLLHASSDTFVNYAEVHTAKLLALVRRIVMPERYNVDRHAGEPVIGACGRRYHKHHPAPAVT